MTIYRCKEWRPFSKCWTFWPIAPVSPH